MAAVAEAMFLKCQSERKHRRKHRCRFEERGKDLSALVLHIDRTTERRKGKVLGRFEIIDMN